MTPREELEMRLMNVLDGIRTSKQYQEELESRERAIRGRLDVLKREEEEVSSLAPRPPDPLSAYGQLQMSGWRLSSSLLPTTWSGMVFPNDRTFMEDEGAAQMMSRYLQKSLAIWQMYHKMYGCAGRWPSEDGENWCIALKPNGTAFVTEYSTTQFNSPSFKTKEDAEMVLRRLIREGLT